jgi:hypothetical protein
MKTFPILIIAIMASLAYAGDQYTVQVNSVLAISSSVWHQFMKDAVQGDNAACQELVDAKQAVFITKPVQVYLVRVEGELAVVRIDGSNAPLWTSVTSIKRP